MTQNVPLDSGDIAVEPFFDAVQEMMSSGEHGFEVVLLNPNTVRVPAGPAEAQASIAIAGQYRFVTAPADRGHPGGAAGAYDLYVTSRANDPATGAPAANDYSFALAIVPVGNVPAGVDIWRRVRQLQWDGAAITRIDRLDQEGPARHAAAHAAGGTDPLTPGMIGAAAAGDLVAHEGAPDPHPQYALDIDLLRDTGAGIASMRTLGPGAQQAAPGNDARLSDARVSPANSVTTAQLQNGAITPTKIDATQTYALQGITGATGGLHMNAPAQGEISITVGASTEISYRGGFHIFRSAVSVGTADGDIYYRTAFPSSSGALKTDVEEIADPLALIRALRGVRFRWRDTGRLSMGLIAEEAEAVVPEAVSRVAADPEADDAQDIVGLNYEALVAPLIAAVQVLADRVDELSARLAG